MSIKASLPSKSFLYLQERSLLNTTSPHKKTYHLVFRWDHPLPYVVGDSLALAPHNDPQEVEALLQALHATGDEPLLDAKEGKIRTARAFFTERANLHELSATLLRTWSERNAASPPTEAHLIDLVQDGSLSLEELPALVRPLLPRFYSIASSPRLFPHEIHLTVACKTYLHRGVPRYGVSSHFLCHHLTPSTPVSCYIQPSKDFSVPHDTSIPMLLIGPGTGIAPFRAFLQERSLSSNPGAHWLFFGERHRASDFYYEEFWRTLEREGRLRLTLAFSRDQPEKIYVQHRLYEEKEEVWRWIQKGCKIYICGDADHMAKAVEETLQKIFQEVGNLSSEEAKKTYKTLRKEKRLLLDVY